MNMIKIMKIDPDAILPSKAHPTDAGYDLYAVQTLTIQPGESALVGTGIAMALPTATEAQVRPRSGIALKHQVTVLNAPGTIDADYRGEVKVILINHGRAPFQIEKGMKIAQMVIAPVLATQLSEASSLDDTQRGEGGFGSSGM